MSANDDTFLDFLHVAIIVVVLLVNMPLFIWTCILLYKHRHEQFLIKRRLFLTYIVMTMLTIVVLSGAICRFVAIFYYDDGNTSFDEIRPTQRPIYAIYWAILIPMVNISTTIYLIRIWLLYFDLQLYQSMKNHDWRMAIDPTTESNNWFLNPFNQRIFANDGKYLFAIGLFIAIMEVVSIYILLFGENQTRASPVIVLALLLIKGSLMGFILQKFGKFTLYDNFGIRDELVKTVVSSMTCALSNTITFLFVIYLGSNQIKYYIIVDLQMALFMIVATYLSGIYIIEYNCKIKIIKFIKCFDKRENVAAKLRKRLASASQDYTTKDNGHNNNNNNNQRPAHWSKITCNVTGYEAFMTHLQSEFSIENLLFITEYAQIKQVLKQKYPTFEQLMNDHNNNNNNKAISFFIQLPEIEQLFIKKKSSLMTLETDSIHVPISLIAQQLYNDGNVTLAFKALYLKYVDSNNAPFMINISYNTREKLAVLLDPNRYNQGQNRRRSSIFASRKAHNGKIGRALINDEWKKHQNDIMPILTQLVAEMDNAAKEVSLLMKDSFSRFDMSNINLIPATP